MAHRSAVGRIGAMLSRRLSIFFAIWLVFPTAQVVNPQRDRNAEENLAVVFDRLRAESGLPVLKRMEGTAFARAACQGAKHGRHDQVWVEDSDYAATMYSSPTPESITMLAQLAARSWPPDRRLAIGACAATTPAYPAGRDWVAIGILKEKSERVAAELLGGRPVSDKHSGE